MGTHRSRLADVYGRPSCLQCAAGRGCGRRDVDCDVDAAHFDVAVIRPQPNGRRAFLASLKRDLRGDNVLASRCLARARAARRQVAGVGEPGAYTIGDYIDGRHGRSLSDKYGGARRPEDGGWPGRRCGRRSGRRCGPGSGCRRGSLGRRRCGPGSGCRRGGIGRCGCGCRRFWSAWEWVWAWRSWSEWA